jgi:hypothetical protein
MTIRPDHSHRIIAFFLHTHWMHIQRNLVTLKNLFSSKLVDASCTLTFDSKLVGIYLSSDLFSIDNNLPDLLIVVDVGNEVGFFDLHQQLIHQLNICSNDGMLWWEG